MSYGFSDEDWAQIKERTREILINIAQDNKPHITYSDLANQIGFDIHHRGPQMSGLLEDICISEHAAGRGLLTVLVVNINNGRPAEGFFSLAKSLGYDVSDEEAFWIQENKIVREYWNDK